MSDIDFNQAFMYLTPSQIGALARNHTSEPTGRTKVLLKVIKAGKKAFENVASQHVATSKERVALAAERNLLRTSGSELAHLLAEVTEIRDRLSASNRRLIAETQGLQAALDIATKAIATASIKASQETAAALKSPRLDLAVLPGARVLSAAPYKFDE